MVRSLITGGYIGIYLLCVNLWIYKLSTGQLTLVQNRVFGYALSLFMVLSLFIDIKIPNNRDNQFIDVAFMCLIVNFIINILNYTGIFGYDAPNMFYSFNGLIFALTSMILISGGRHGIFKD
jgi:hypothetical protein